MIEEIMANRRSVRKFKAQRPDSETIKSLIQAAGQAPSANNKQPWRFFILNDKGKIDTLAELVREAAKLIGQHVEPAFQETFAGYSEYFVSFINAPVVIAPCFSELGTLSQLVDDNLPETQREQIREMERKSSLMSIACAIQNLMLTAHASGLGTTCLTGPLISAVEIEKFLKIPPSWRLAALIPVGYPDEEPKKTQRQPVERIIRWVD